MFKWLRSEDLLFRTRLAKNRADVGTACRRRRLKVPGSVLPKRASLVGPTTQPVKKTVTETQTKTSIPSFLGEGEASAPAEPMRDSGQTRKESTGPTTSSSNKSLRIASWNVRTMYEAGKSSQVTNQMRRYKLDILGISETHWIQSGQKRLNTGEQILFSGRKDQQHSKELLSS